VRLIFLEEFPKADSEYFVFFQVIDHVSQKGFWTTDKQIYPEDGDIRLVQNI
jgi:hypothetical protein